jgi:TonB family protein
MPNSLPRVGNTVVNKERRASRRLRVMSLIYVDLGSLNGGIVTDIGENGLALTAAVNLGGDELGDELLKMRVQLPGVEGGIDASGHIVWRSKSRKETGVRFVDLSPDALEQIRNWLASQAPATGVQPDRTEPPKAERQRSKAAHPRAPRFSFSEVAISRVDGVEEPSAVDLGEALRETESGPSQGMESGVFADAKKVVASVFGNAALTEERQEQAYSPPAEQQTPVTPDSGGKESEPLSAPERRLHSRRRILLFTYAALSEDNGGLVFNLGEDGLALTTAVVLRDHHFEQMRFRFPDSEDWIEARGRLAWISNSGKEAGVEFLSLPESARTRIREWVALDPVADSRQEEHKPQTIRHPAQELPSFAAPQRTVSRSTESQVPASSRAALFASGIRGVVARAAIKKRVAGIKPPLYAVYSARARASLIRTVSAFAALFALLAVGWVSIQRGYLDKAMEIITRNTPDAASAVEPKQNTGPATERASANPPIPQVDSAPQPSGTPQAAVANLDANPEPSLKNNAPKESVTTGPAVVNLKTQQSERLKPERTKPVRPEPRKKTPPPYQPMEKPRQTVAVLPTSAPPPENKPAQIATAQPMQAKGLNVASSIASNVGPSSLSSSAVHPEPAPAVSSEKEKPPVVQPKQPEVPVARTPVITVSFDPYPSIRMPPEANSKKSRQGQSLQMGHLLMRVEPVYPEEAKQRGIEGTVRVHAIFNREGSVQNLISATGPSLLIPAAMNAVRQWRFTQTLLGGKPMETEEDVTVEFRLWNSASKN